MTAVALERNGLDAASRVLPRQKASSPAARHFVRGVLKDWDLTGVEDDAALVVTELVNNAVRHTRTSSLRVSVRRMSSNTVRVGVIDRGPSHVPEPRPAGLMDTGGRGLELVDAVTQAWGYTRWPWAK